MKQRLPLTSKTTKRACRKRDLGAKRNETKNLEAHKLPHKITTDINVAGEFKFVSNRIFRHGLADEIVFINVGGRKLTPGTAKSRRISRR